MTTVYKPDPFIVRKVNNGYLVTPAPSLATGNMVGDEDILVFETLGSLVTWIHMVLAPCSK